MQISSHILATEGILTTFAIAKRVSAEDVTKIKNKVKKSAPANADSGTIDDLLREAILEDTQKAIMNDEIPGLIFKKIAEEDEQKKRLMELTFFASVIAKKMKEKKIDKYHSCYIINAIVNMLGLTENDFDDFHDKFKNGGNSDSDDSLE
jgi:hypothetical protein